jgi:hypothetical protein
MNEQLENEPPKKNNNVNWRLILLVFGAWGLFMLYDYWVQGV